MHYKNQPNAKTQISTKVKNLTKIVFWFPKLDRISHGQSVPGGSSTRIGPHVRTPARRTLGAAV